MARAASRIRARILVLSSVSVLAVFLGIACAAGFFARQPRSPVDVSNGLSIGPNGKSGIPRAAAKPLWNELSPSQRSVLEPLAAEWDAMTAERKKKWITIGNRFSSMSAVQKQRVQRRMQLWATLKEQQRRSARHAYMQAKKFDRQEKLALWRQYQQAARKETAPSGWHADDHILPGESPALQAELSLPARSGSDAKGSR